MVFNDLDIFWGEPHFRSGMLGKAHGLQMTPSHKNLQSLNQFANWPSASAVLLQNQEKTIPINSPTSEFSHHSNLAKSLSHTWHVHSLPPELHRTPTSGPRSHNLAIGLCSCPSNRPVLQPQTACHRLGRPVPGASQRGQRGQHIPQLSAICRGILQHEDQLLRKGLRSFGTQTT